MIIENRKKDHIEICLNKDVQFDKTLSGFEKYQFVHQALPEINFDEIDLSINIFDKKLNAPIFVSSMTGGLEKARLINKNIAIACQNLGLAMALGSQRIMLENPQSVESFNVRKYAKDILLFGNIGAVQLNYGVGLKECLKIIEQIKADVLFLHLNPLQEAIQEEGDKNFSGLLKKIETLAKDLPYPIVIKECGCGISEELAIKLSKTKIAGIDVSGSSGTSWALIEGYRAKNNITLELGKTFKNWGIPTAESLVYVKKHIKDKFIFSSGGIRSGIDIAKAIALGSNMVGIALPLLESATISSRAVEERLIQFIQELKITMFCIGVKNIDELKNTKLINRID